MKAELTLLFRRSSKSISLLRWMNLISSKKERSIVESVETNNSSREIIKEKLRQNFDGKIVRKDLTKKIKEGANVPVYVLEFLLVQYCSSDDEEIINQGVDRVKRILADNFVRPDEAQKIKRMIECKGDIPRNVIHKENPIKSFVKELEKIDY